MEKENKLFLAIIIGSFIIGGFVYLGITSKPTEEKNNNATLSLSSNAKNSNVKPLSSEASKCQANEIAVVTKVVDGDTVVVEGGYHVRLLGIDADEKNYPCYGAAKTRLEELVLQKQVRLEKDITDVDQYGRCLRTIFLADQNIDAKLVREGLASARFYEPDVQYRSQIQTAQKEAIENKMGCKWSKIK